MGCCGCIRATQCSTSRIWSTTAWRGSYVSAARNLFSMRAIIAASLGLVMGGLVGFGIATYWLVNEYQSLRYRLEDVHLTVPINIRDRRLGDVAKALAEEVKHQKGAKIQFVFSPE